MLIIDEHFANELARGTERSNYNLKKCITEYFADHSVFQDLFDRNESYEEKERKKNNFLRIRD